MHGPVMVGQRTSTETQELSAAWTPACKSSKSSRPSAPLQCLPCLLTRLISASIPPKSIPNAIQIKKAQNSAYGRRITKTMSLFPVIKCHIYELGDYPPTRISNALCSSPTRSNEHYEGHTPAWAESDSDGRPSSKASVHISPLEGRPLGVWAPHRVRGPCNPQWTIPPRWMPSSLYRSAAECLVPPVLWKSL